ncbi:phosphoribosylformylglycinamidine cyclo-ligase [Tenuibacillus multivorans]|uniref:Phosphoribosylformylglycinamidine cyclo-ligase n=1 Tax=Tenuibacillus multivorans TaxID=237069 RepID=A0A1H0F949_9BACI|nr:phosphoribosylformylglycinamidine cyclo-ligase [Tenuibacillus multivorans]GEL78027.1 phosphoribosylformylglycinamidine cyclo-ligase [Tenuibacillus multivorans]SDN91042.1 phosphoribosylformylglycinamidine cyclo-ligase [Tenuibacillus multivorans]
MSEAYKQAGVNIEAGYEAVDRIKQHVDRTSRLGVMGALGSFGGMFDLSSLNYQEPVLISGTDGVGTKLKLAFDMNRHDTIGVDAVAMCVNDIVVQGAEPLYFLDYIALGQSQPKKIESIVKGIADGCEQSGCALIGGETAEMPGVYDPNDYDVAGFAVGVSEKSELITSDSIQAGDYLIGLPSSGVHSNGYSLVQHIIDQANLSLDQIYEPFTQPLGDVLLTPTRIYVDEILRLKEKGLLKGAAHITGGGFYENIPRMLPAGLGAEVDISTFSQPSIFRFLQEKGDLTHDDMYRVFNMGIGMVIAIEADQVNDVFNLLDQAYVIGQVKHGEGIKLKAEGQA